MTFESLNLNTNILKALTQAGYQKATPIQQQAIPKIVDGFDIRGSAQTGTGKTAAFLLPALNRLAAAPTKKGAGPRILILVPTRELAMQVAEQASKYSRFLKEVKTVCIVGGVPYPAQIRNLSRPYDILIATPGRLIDFIDRGKILFPKLEMLILDEADRMLDMGFLEPVQLIASKTPTERQTVLFSATMHGSVLKLSNSLLKSPVEVAIKPEQERCDHIKQSLHFADDINHKVRLLEHVLNSDETNQVIIFTATKRQAEKLSKDLISKDFPAAALHGDMNQGKRNRTLAQIKKGHINILIATDVAARGIDIPTVSHVINFDIPRTVEDYIHRIGRTGRAGANGNALSFITRQERGLVRKIEEHTRQKIAVVEFAGLESRVKEEKSSKPAQRPRSRQKPFKQFNKKRSPKRRSSK